MVLDGYVRVSTVRGRGGVDLDRRISRGRRLGGEDERSGYERQSDVSSHSSCTSFRPCRSRALAAINVTPERRKNLRPFGTGL